MFVPRERVRTTLSKASECPLRSVLSGARSGAHSLREGNTVFKTAKPPGQERSIDQCSTIPDAAPHVSRLSAWLVEAVTSPAQSFGTILNANGENPKVSQELMSHADLRVTMDTFVQAVSDEKRNAQSKVVEMLLPGIAVT